MGHRRYVQEGQKTKQHSHDYTKTPNPRARNYFDEMAPVNGVIEYSEDDHEIANRQREEMRDIVSKRMGELLLRGVTMLDAYCQKCNGILMEDRNKIKTCIQCEVFTEKFGEIDPKAAMEIEQLGEKDDTFKNVPAVEQKVIEVNMDTYNQKPNQSGTPFSNNMEEKIKLLSMTTNSAIALPGYVAAVRAIDNKLSWAAARLNDANIAESMEYLRFIEEAMKILKSI